MFWLFFFFQWKNWVSSSFFPWLSVFQSFVTSSSQYLLVSFVYSAQTTHTIEVSWNSTLCSANTSKTFYVSPRVSTCYTRKTSVVLTWHQLMMSLTWSAKYLWSIDSWIGIADWKDHLSNFRNWLVRMGTCYLQIQGDQEDNLYNVTPEGFVRWGNLTKPSGETLYKLSFWSSCTCKWNFRKLAWSWSQVENKK